MCLHIGFRQNSVLHLLITKDKENQQSQQSAQPSPILLVYTYALIQY